MKIQITAQPNSSLANKTGSWRTYKPRTDYVKCISCGTCSRVCPEGCIYMENLTGFDKLKPVTDYDYCKGCSVCSVECPVKAIIMGLEKK
jgi:2-oxoacid:acceptor oxidoreductase delta subunit (pyruvate/2-ketoisovalerate family)